MAASSEEQRVVSLNRPFAAGKTVMEGPSAKPVFRPHGMDGWVLNLTIAGIGVERSGENHHYLRHGDLALWEPEAFHSYGNEEEARYWVHLWVYFFPNDEQKKLLRWTAIGPGIQTFHVGEKTVRENVEAIFQEILRVNATLQPCRNEICAALLTTLLWWCENVNPHSLPRVIDPRIRRVLDHIAARLADRHQVEDLADRACLSPSRFAHLFAEEMRMTPIRFIEAQRVQKACELIHLTSDTIAEIGRKVGYEDPAYFSRVFRRHTGRAPAHYRAG